LLDKNLSFFQAVEYLSTEQLIAEFKSDISAARQVSGIDLLCAIGTSIWRSSVTICCALNVFFGTTNSLQRPGSHKSLSKKFRAGLGTVIGKVPKKQSPAQGRDLFLSCLVAAFSRR